MTQSIINFAEAFLTVLVAGLSGVMVQGQAFVWPSWPAFAIIGAGAVLAGIRKVQAAYSAPPR